MDEGDRLEVGSRRLALGDEYACSFRYRSGFLSWLDELSGAPAVEVRARGGAVRFRPGRYERVAMARLVHALCARATAGDARRWLVSTWDLPPDHAVPEARGRWIHPLVGTAIGLLFAVAAAVNVFTAASVLGR
jgi:hypothetical protein